MENINLKNTCITKIQVYFHWLLVVLFLFSFFYFIVVSGSVTSFPFAHIRPLMDLYTLNTKGLLQILFNSIRLKQAQSPYYPWIHDCCHLQENLTLLLWLRYKNTKWLSWSSLLIFYLSIISASYIYDLHSSTLLSFSSSTDT